MLADELVTFASCWQIAIVAAFAFVAGTFRVP
jgi:hypothetical protein